MSIAEYPTDRYLWVMSGRSTWIHRYHGSMRRILVTNDDGYFSPGIQALAAALAPLGEVTIVAPQTEASAVGHALTLRRPLRLEQIATASTAVDGTPTDCVNIAIDEVLEGKPDLVVSGINKGLNVGDDVTYSGTVAGALEGALLGYQAIAVSLEFTRGEWDFAPAALAAARSPRAARAAAAGADVSQHQRAAGAPVGRARDRAGQAQSHHQSRPAARPAPAAVLLDRGSAGRLGAATSGRITRRFGTATCRSRRCSRI